MAVGGQHRAERQPSHLTCAVMAKHIPRWAKLPTDQDFDAVLNFLTLQFTDVAAKRLVRKARSGRRIERIAKDILRVSELPPL